MGGVVSSENQEKNKRDQFIENSLNLPKDVWSLILQYCDIRSITALSLVSKSWVQCCWNLVYKLRMSFPSNHDLRSFFNRNNQIYSINIQNASLLTNTDFNCLIYLTALQRLKIQKAREFNGLSLMPLQNLQKLALTHQNCENLKKLNQWIYGLTNLTSLDFSYSTKLENIWSDLSQLPKLSSLKLSHSWNSGNLRITNLSLTRLHLDGVDLSEENSKQLTALTSLRDLSLGLVKMKYYNDNLNFIHNFVDLVSLNLNALRIFDEHFSTFTTLGRLEYLNISCCKHLSESLQIIPEYFCNLTYLNVSETRISNKELFSFKKLSWLSNLHLGNTFLITDEGIQYLQFCTRITTLRLNKSKKIRNQCLNYLSPMVYLNILNLSGCIIDDEGLSFLKLRNLTDLDLSFCPDITDDGLVFLQSMPIYNLKLSFCSKITGKSLSSLNPNILYLCLSHSGLTNTSLEVVGQLTNLQNLDISYCPKVTSEGLVHLKGCQKLQILGLSGTKVTDDTMLTLLHHLRNLRKIGYMSCELLTYQVLLRLNEL